jgi:hypothetical protein
MYACVQFLEVFFQGSIVVAPPHSIDPGCGMAFERQKGLLGRFV